MAGRDDDRPRFAGQVSPVISPAGRHGAAGDASALGPAIPSASSQHAISGSTRGRPGLCRFSTAAFTFFRDASARPKALTMPLPGTPAIRPGATPCRAACRRSARRCFTYYLPLRLGHGHAGAAAIALAEAARLPRRPPAMAMPQRAEDGASFDGLSATP